MQEIDVLLDESPDLSLELIENDIRNQLAHKELETFNNTGHFANVHPFCIINKAFNDQYNELMALKTDNPTEFLSEITNVTQNIRRIESQIRQKKYKDDSTLKNWSQNLERAKTRLNIISLIINQ